MRVPDRQKQRREYLKKKARTSTLQVGGILLLAVVGFPTVLLFLLAVFFVVMFCLTPLGSFAIIGFCICAALGVGGVSVCHALNRMVAAAAKQSRSLPYFPPVTIDTLPAEEVLVRSSQEPTQEHSAVLLRAAGESNDTPAEQLLRAAVSEPDKG